MVKIKQIKIIILSMFLLFMLSYSVSAFGVSSPYWDENPLYVNPGETKDVRLVLQNMVGDGDITVNANVNSGHDIATLIDQVTTYSVPLGSNNIPVNLRINVPKNVKPGQEWQVGVSFRTVSEDLGGVTLAGAVDKGFKVIVKETRPSEEITKPEIPGQLSGFLILVVILVIVWLLVSYFHKKRSSK